MKIYVDEMPKSCMECLFGNEVISSDDYCVCGAVKNGMCQSYEQAINKEECPLKTIQSIQNQKAVEALQEIYDYAIKHYNEEESDMKVAVAYRKVATKASELISELGGHDD